MGLQHDVQTDSGLQVKNAYTRIDRFEGRDTMTISTSTYASRQNFLEYRSPIKTGRYSFEPSFSEDAIDLLSQGYASLKDERDFAGAIDV
jgi:hypothetical protein